jgi:uncharacterized protein DUF3810
MRLRLAILFVAASAALVPTPAPLVERWYSTAAYPQWQSLVTPLSNRVPFALLDVSILLVAAAWIVALGADTRRARGAWLWLLTRAAVRTLVWGAALYLLFLAAWGLNYRRTKFAERVVFDAAQISAPAAASLARTAVTSLNALYEEARTVSAVSARDTDGKLVSAFVEVQHALGVPPAVPGLPKQTWLDLYFRRAGVAGMTDPYFLETLVATDLLPFERPFVEAHEWGHLAGFADESEASFVGWLACLRGSAGDRYSGWLFLYGELARAMDGRDRAELSARLNPGPREDLQAIARRLQQQVSPAVSAAGWRVYDRYLKANRIKSGAANYGEVVRLVLGVRFGPGWTPILKQE